MNNIHNVFKLLSMNNVKSSYTTNNFNHSGIQLDFIRGNDNYEYSINELINYYGDKKLFILDENPKSNEISILDNDMIKSSNNINNITTSSIITNSSQIVLCMPGNDLSITIIYDKNKKVLALCSTSLDNIFDGILVNTIDKMISSYGCSAKDLIVSVSPYLKGCCNSIDNDTYIKILNNGYEYALNFREGSIYLNLESLVRVIAKSLDVLDENIEISDICTNCSNSFYSKKGSDTSGFMVSVSLN